MNPEFSSNQVEVSGEKWEDLKQESQNYVDRALELARNNVSMSCVHILRNLAAGLSGLILQGKSEKAYQGATEELEKMKRYFKLLEDYPDFALKEKSPGKGYFPDASVILGSNKTEDLITYFENQLGKQDK